jgi:uncharacterized RDD family membrane protein YckC
VGILRATEDGEHIIGTAYTVRMTWPPYGEPIPTTLATRRVRLLAFLIDQLLALAAASLSRMLALSVVGVLAYVCLVAFAIVQIILVGTRGQTIGKMLLKIAIVDRIDKVPPGFVRAALIRQLPLMVVSFFTPTFTLIYLFVDGSTVFATPRRCVHDYIAGTVVVNVPRQESAAAADLMTNHTERRA